MSKTIIINSFYKLNKKYCGKCGEEKSGELTRCDECKQKLRTKPRSKKKYNA